MEIKFRRDNCKKQLQFCIKLWEKIFSVQKLYFSMRQLEGIHG